MQKGSFVFYGLQLYGRYLPIRMSPDIKFRVLLPVGSGIINSSQIIYINSNRRNDE